MKRGAGIRRFIAFSTVCVVIAVTAVLASCNLTGSEGFTEYYVDISGSNTSGDGSQSAPWRTISYALATVNYYDKVKINVSGGTFTERLTITESVFIRGSGQNPEQGGTTLKNPSPTDGWMIDVSGDDVSFRLENIRIESLDRNFEQIKGMRVKESVFRLVDVTIYKPLPYGIVIEDSPSFTIEDSSVDSAGLSWFDYGIDIYDSFGTIDGFYGGDHIDHIININDGSNVVVENSTLEGSPIYYADGIRVLGNSNLLVADTVIRRSDDADSLPEGQPHGPSWAGIEINSEAQNRFDIRNTEISGFDVGIGLNAEKAEIVIENSDLTGNVFAGVATSWHWYKPDSDFPSLAPSVDLGGGPLNSAGNNTFGTQASWGFVHDAPYDVEADFNDWGVSSGQVENRIYDDTYDSELGTVHP